MSNLRTILESLVKNIQGGDLTAYSKEMVEEAKREIKGLIPTIDEIFNTVWNGRADESGNKIGNYIRSRYIRKIASAIRSAMLKKIRGEVKQLCFEQGLAYAIAEIIRMHDEPTIAIDILKNSGLTFKELKIAGTIKYDLDVIEKAIKKQSPGRNK